MSPNGYLSEKHKLSLSERRDEEGDIEPGIKNQLESGNKLAPPYNLKGVYVKRVNKEDRSPKNHPRGEAMKFLTKRRRTWAPISRKILR